MEETLKGRCPDP